MTYLTNLDKLKRYITLASVEEKDVPFISCNLNLENRLTGCHSILNKRRRNLQILKGNGFTNLEEALVGGRGLAGFQPAALII